MLASDGQVVWIHDIVNVEATNGLPTKLRGFMIDITNIKRAEEALKKSQEELRMLAGKLLTVQEDERRRIARELHDDISQRLAALAMDAASIGSQLDASSQSIPEWLDELQVKLVTINQDLHNLSRRLHPSILHDLGCMKAIRSECNTASDREGIAVEFTSDGDLDELSTDQAICLFRVVQESLRNIEKHAQTKSARVKLVRHDAVVTLTIEDEGIGFEPVDDRRRAGLGLVSMKERAILCDGKFTVESTPGNGTKVEIQIPLEANGDESSTITPGG